MSASSSSSSSSSTATSTSTATTAPIYSRIVATGSYLPSKVVTNDDLAKYLDTNDEWIMQRTGIKRRHLISVGESATTMAIAASKRALEAANMSAEQIDLIVGATCTNDDIIPSMACSIQNSLNIRGCAAFDVQAACSGFIYALSVADQFVKTGHYKRVLVVGAEAMSKVLNWNDRKTCVLFADGAGACIIEASNTPGIFSTHIHADGGYGDALYLHNRNKPYFFNLDGSQTGAQKDLTVTPVLQMEGNQVFKLAVTALEQLVVDTLAKNNMQPEELDWLVPHQANIRIIQATAKKLGMSMEKVIVTVDEHANTSAASIPLAFDLAIRDGRIKRGDKVLLEAFGAGLSWGSALIQY
jgi:3-oxoacyl-[acyl-carrier-protein] synthase-3